MDSRVEKRRTHIMMLDLFEHKICGVIAAASLIGNPCVERSGVEDVCRFRQRRKPSANHF